MKKVIFFTWMFLLIFIFNINGSDKNAAPSKESQKTENEHDKQKLLEKAPQALTESGKKMSFCNQLGSCFCTLLVSAIPCSCSNNN